MIDFNSFKRVEKDKVYTIKKSLFVGKTFKEWAKEVMSIQERPGKDKNK